RSSCRRRSRPDQDCRATRHRHRRSPSGRRPLQMENAMAALAAHQLSALELLEERRTDSRATRAAGVADDARDGDILALLEDLIELAFEPLGQLALDRGHALLQLIDLRPQID